VKKCKVLLFSILGPLLWRHFSTIADDQTDRGTNQQTNSPSLAPIITWDSEAKSTKVNAGNNSARIVFIFTNISAGSVIITNVSSSCGCTTLKLPPLPWTVLSGGTGQIEASVSINERSGTLFKTITVATDKETNMLKLTVEIIPAPILPPLTASQRAQNVQIAKTNRQAIFREDCAVCHVKPGEGKYGREIYFAVCGVCHEDEHRSDMVPDLHTLKEPTSEKFWRDMISNGKAGTLMPAFSTAQDGPLTDVQIMTLAAYLNAAIPSQ
jgi:mono/diheme cytochrome c family protein